MNVEFVYFRDADKIIRRKKLIQDVKATMNYVSDVLTGTIQRGELLRQVLEETGWREEGVPLNILEGRRYQWNNGHRHGYGWIERLDLGNGKITTGSKR